METQWTGRPVLARALRVLLFVAPGIFAWLAVRALSPLFFQADGVWRLPVWIAQALLVSVIVAKAVGVIAQRLIPLAGLLTLTLVFPDQAPSRFGVALRAGSIRKLQNQAVTLPQDEGEAAAAALELVTAFNKHDRLTRGHMERVRAYSEMIGTEMGLPEQDMNRLRWGTLLHDVGKLTVPSEILQKEGRPTSEEWEILRSHPAAGAEMLKPLANFLGPWLGAAGEHHERWDGDGYPNGFAGTEISLAGRICAVADAYDVITSKRSYKEPHSVESARQELVDCSGTHFDPVVVRSFLHAGLRSPARTGFLGWLLELPRMVGLASIPAAVATGAVAAMAFSFNLAPSAGAPESLAFDESSAAEVVTTTMAPTTAEGAGSMAVTSSVSPPTTVSIVTTPTTTTAAPTTTSADIAGSTSTTTTTTSAPTFAPASVTTMRPPTATGALITTTTTTRAPATTTRPPTTTTTRPPTTTTAAATTTTTTITTTTSTTTTTTTTTTTPPSSSYIVLQATEVISLQPGQHQSDTPLVFQESGATTTQEDIRYRYTSQWDFVGDLPRDTLPSGTRVCSWIVHFEPVTDGLTVEFTIETGQPIIGFTGMGRGDTLEHPSIDYGQRGGMGATDEARVNGTQVSFRLTEGAGDSDQQRIITQC